MFGMANIIRHTRTRAALMKALQILENPSIPEIRAAAILSPRLIILSGLSYQRIYSELRILCANKQSFRVKASYGHALRFSTDPTASGSLRGAIRPVPRLTKCDSCGSTCVDFHQNVCSIQQSEKCGRCGTKAKDFLILSDDYFARKYFIYENAILGVFDYVRLRLPGSIRGHSTEYERAAELLRGVTRKPTLLAIVGQVD